MAEELHFVKTSIVNLVNGEFVKEGESSFVRTKDGKKFYRVRVLGTVVEKFTAKDGNYAALTLDDGTETIRVKFFKESVDMMADIVAGDLLDVFAFAREYEGEIYLAPQIFKKVDDLNIEVLRKLEIAEGKKAGAQADSNILEAIHNLDKGDGVKIEVLAGRLSMETNHVLETLRNLLIKGDLYEPKKGVVKLVE